MEPTFLVVMLGVFVVGAFLQWYASPHQAFLRGLRTVPISDIENAPQGKLVRIVGRVRRRGKLLRSPLTGRKCVYFSAIASEKADRNHYREIAREVESRDFLVEDETGSVAIETARLDVAVVVDHRSASGFSRDANEPEVRLLGRCGQASATFGLKRNLRYEEGILEPGEEVAIVGRAHWKEEAVLSGTNPPRGRDFVATRTRHLVIETFEGHPVRASNDPSVTR